MKFLVAMCLLAAGVSAQYGESGHVAPDGTQTQYTPEEAKNIAVIGPAGVTYNDGTHRQFGLEEAFHYANIPLARKKREVLLQGPAGVLFKDGQKRPLPVGVYIVLMSEAGAVLSNGDNVQFRKKRAFSSPPVVGDSGYITSSGKQYQFDNGVTILIKGDTGLLLSNGQAVNLYD